ncbi:DNA mismatch repair protein Msh6 [Araneus ventricosus]|uniref:DNA mismatch repair protein Msh6 n=1 Tax=Araneus ventricosus TaxID=182803 RepID=A0A4Y2FWM4_ARAVE|nr:DNA mismatch repair protein Msh6 [Araneus ventricosus]
MDLGVFLDFVSTEMELPHDAILYERSSITKKTFELLNHHLTGTTKEVIASFHWDSQRVLRFLQKTEIFTKEDDTIEYPETLMQMLDPDDKFLETPLKQYELTFRSLGACLRYLQQCCIEDSLLSMKLFEVYVPLDEVQSASVKDEIRRVPMKNSNNFKKHMILDGVTLQNLEIVPMLSSGNPEGTLFGTMDYCSTSFDVEYDKSKAYLKKKKIVVIKLCLLDVSRKKADEREEFMEGIQSEIDPGVSTC